MPGYAVWWQYAQDSPYYKEYFEEQWKLYGKVKQEKAALIKNVSYRNLLLCAFVIFIIFVMLTLCLTDRNFIAGMVIFLEAVLSTGISVLLRSIGIWCNKHR